MTISKHIMEAVDKFVPHKMSKQKRHLPWVNPAIKPFMNRRDQARKKRGHGKGAAPMQIQSLRNVTSKRIRSAHDNYLQELVGGIVQDPSSSPQSYCNFKRAWSYLKLIRTESTGIPTLSGDKVCTSDNTKAEALRKHFDSMFTSEKLDAFPHLPASPYSDIPEIKFTVPGIQKQLEAIRPDKACGPDLVPARILKEAASELAPVFTNFFQQSYDSGEIPLAWKEANISAIFKKGIRSDPTNYRLVSLTSIVCKVMEHVVCSHMTSHLTSNSIISRH